MKFAYVSKRILTGQHEFFFCFVLFLLCLFCLFFNCLLISNHKLMLTKIFRAVVEFLMSTVFTCLSSFPCGLTIHSQLKGFERQSLKRFFFINVSPVQYIAGYYNKDQQFGVRYTRQDYCYLCLKYLWQIYCFFVPDSLHMTFMLSLLPLVLLLLQTNSKKQEMKWRVLSCYFYEGDPLHACSGTLMISTHINRI